MPNTRRTNRHRRTPSELREYVLDCEAQIAAEAERRSRFTPEEKVAENFSSLSNQLDEDPSLLLFLQPTPPGHMARARCYASCCVVENAKGVIRDDYRILVPGQVAEYFHVQCLEKMPELARLAPTRFKLDTRAYPWYNYWSWSWNFTLREWFEHSGCIDLEMIIEHGKALAEYREEHGDFDTQWLDWWSEYGKQHEQHEQHAEPCDCAPKPEKPEGPILGDYVVSEDRACPLTAVIECE